eukprot:jgi/Mesvir1/27426/Mv07218-RA.1
MTTTAVRAAVSLQALRPAVASTSAQRQLLCARIGKGACKVALTRAAAVFQSNVVGPSAGSFRLPVRMMSDAARVASDGDTVSMHYTGTLDDGSVFDSSRGRGPFSFVVGSGQVIKGFDTMVRGLKVGEQRKARLPASEAYGERMEELMARVPKDGAPEGLEAGVMVELGNGAIATVTAVTDTYIEIDANHRLAGQALTFDVELMSIA